MSEPTDLRNLDRHGRRSLSRVRDRTPDDVAGWLRVARLVDRLDAFFERGRDKLAPETYEQLAEFFGPVLEGARDGLLVAYFGTPWGEDARRLDSDKPTTRIVRRWIAKQEER